ncbi:MAG: hypothetical protein JO283_00100 [Bradyrhizobium sp.]|nr:hypothetical protein [Bradyrhizobium sp.]
MRAELERIEADAGDPLADEAGVLTCREAAAVVATTGEQEIASFLQFSLRYSSMA